MGRKGTRRRLNPSSSDSNYSCERGGKRNIFRSSTKSEITSVEASSQNLCDESNCQNPDRRSFIQQLPIQLSLLGGTITITADASPTNAATGEKVKTPLTTAEAETKFREGYQTITYLIDNYEAICEGGGDNVRRYLGTIVSNPPSSLVGIGKTMKALEDKADDFIEFTETSDEVLKSIDQASGSAYMAIFVTTSTSYTPPKKYFDDGLIEVKRCKKTMEKLAEMVDVKL